jgi:uncharacterized membrane protein YhaH (DUF805 family)
MNISWTTNRYVIGLSVLLFLTLGLISGSGQAAECVSPKSTALPHWCFATNVRTDGPATTPNKITIHFDVDGVTHQGKVPRDFFYLSERSQQNELSKNFGPSIEKRNTDKRNYLEPIWYAVNDIVKKVQSYFQGGSRNVIFFYFLGDSQNIIMWIIGVGVFVVIVSYFSSNRRVRDAPVRSVNSSRDSGGSPQMAARTQQKIGLFAAIGYGFKGYFTWRGRSTRAEFWYWFLSGVLVFSFVVALMGFLVPVMPVGSGEYLSYIWLIYVCVILLPTLSVQIRRLHDTDHNGWWVLFGWIPIIGTIVILIWLCRKGTEGTNRFGESRTTVRLGNNDQFGLDAEVELEFWRSIKDSADPDMFRAYLEKYPNGKFVELAKIKFQSFAGHQIFITEEQHRRQDRIKNDSSGMFYFWMIIFMSLAAFILIFFLNRCSV